MAWEKLPTNYTNAQWSGLKKYNMIENTDGTISFEDVTQYDKLENSFFGANDANSMNAAINNIMEVGIRGKNLLYNWYFVNPVNPRGETEYTMQGETISKWSLTNNAGKVNIVDDGITISGISDNTEFRQFVENEEGVLGKKVTISAIVNDELYSVTGIIPDGDITEDYKVCQVAMGDWSFDLYKRLAGEVAIQFRVLPDKVIKVNSVKLELGEVQTLAYQDDGKWVLYEIPSKNFIYMDSEIIFEGRTGNFTKTLDNFDAISFLSYPTAESTMYAKTNAMFPTKNILDRLSIVDEVMLTLFGNGDFNMKINNTSIITNSTDIRVYGYNIKAVSY